MKLLKIFLLMFVLFFLVSCNSEGNKKLAKKEYPNQYAAKTLLILGKGGNFKTSFIGNIVWRTKKNYSIKVDDLDKIYDYNFSEFNNVLLVESPEGNEFKRVQQYMNGYGGVNNILFVGVVDKVKDGLAEKYEKSLGLYIILVPNDSEEENKSARNTVRKLRSI